MPNINLTHYQNKLPLVDLVIQVLNHPVIPEIFYRESNDRPSIQALEGDVVTDSWMSRAHDDIFQENA